MKILIFGISGLIGNSLFTYLSKDNNLKVYGTSRRKINSIQDNIFYFEWSSKSRIKNLNSIIKKCKPDLVINCIGITKHHQEKNKSDYINLNSNLPHEIARVSNELNAKFLQVSTDCVFSGKLGNYDELAICDSKEIYGISKFNGEIIDNFNLTIRISTLGREIETKNGLLEWFLNQEKRCFGYKSAFFSGITTYELSQIIINYIIPNINRLNGLYHMSGEKINKFLLLNKLSKVYNKKIKIIPTSDLKIDRSLNSEKFQHTTGYTKKNWDDMLSKNYI